MKKSVIKHEAKEFDKETIERITHGIVPDLRRLKKVAYFYNNPWREPEFVKIQIIPRVNFVLKHLRSPRVLELGCGRGYLALEMARYGHNVFGVDISSESIAIAKKMRKKIHIIGVSGRLYMRWRILWCWISAKISMIR